MNILRLFAAFLIVIGTIACQPTEKTATESSNTSADKSELEELYWNRIENSRSDFTEADVKFMTGMIAHHAQALIMSRLAPKNGASAQIQRLASRIINAQQDEIASMQQWLRDRNQPVPKIEIDGLNLMIELNSKPYTMYKKMRGVLSDQQLKELAAAKGSDFDKLFLKYMIEHHSGAVYMVENLFNKDGAAEDNEAFKLASDIQVDQRTEIERMKLMLDQITTSG